MSVIDIIYQRVGDQPIEAALVLGSGLSGLGALLQNRTSIAFAHLQGFPGYGKSSSGVSGHGRELLIGDMSGKRIAILTGREHYYEHGNAAAMRPALETIKALGAKTVLLTNSAGSLDPEVQPGELMLLKDHINYAGMNPLIGEATDRRFVNMVDCYNPQLRAKAQEAAKGLGIPLKEGVYLWYSGPSFETVAEIQMAIRLGANAVGMSTAPEVILARMLGLNVWACSSITNMGAGLSQENISQDHTKSTAKICAEKLERLIPALMEAI